MIKWWWHFEYPHRFWYCYVLGGGPPIYKHRSGWLAKREAVRLAQKIGLPVYVLKAECVVLPDMPAPAPDCSIHYWGDQFEDFANRPEDIRI